MEKLIVDQPESWNYLMSSKLMSVIRNISESLRFRSEYIEIQLIGTIYHKNSI